MFHSLDEKFKDIAEAVAGINKILERNFGSNPPLYLKRSDAKLVFMSKESVLSLNEGLSWMKRNMSLSESDKKIIQKLELPEKVKERSYDDRQY